MWRAGESPQSREGSRYKDLKEGEFVSTLKNGEVIGPELSKQGEGGTVVVGE